MSHRSNIYLDDVGTIFELTVRDEVWIPIDLTEVILKEIIFEKPDLTLLTKDAEFSGDGMDGLVRYTTIADDVDQEGRWRVRAHVQFASSEFYSTWAVFTVRPLTE